MWVGIIATPLLAANGLPTPATNPSGGNVRSQGDAGWGQNMVRLVLPEQNSLLCGPMGCPFAVSGQQVLDLKAGKLSGVRLEEAHGRSGCLSGDGKYFASKLAGKDAGIGVWSSETGKQLATIPANEKERICRFVSFAGPKTVLIAVQGKAGKMTIELYDAATGKQVRLIPGVGPHGQNQAATTLDGRSVAVVGHDHIVVYNLASGSQTAVMHDPPSGPGGDPKTPDKAPRPRPANVPDLQAVFLYAGTLAIAFSNDGKELAALFQRHQESRLVAWDNRGNVVFDQDLPSLPLAVPDAQNLVWAPDSSAWLVARSLLLDRKSRLMVWRLPMLFGQTTPVEFTDNDHLLACTDGKALQSRIVPWGQIRKSIDSMMGKGPAILRPGGSISVNLQMSQPDPDVTSTIVDALTKRLAKDGIKVADGQPLTVAVRFDEKQGQSLKIVESTSPFDIAGRDTGRTAHEYSSAAQVELRSKDKTEPLWHAALYAVSNRTFRDDITDQTTRKSMLDSLGRQLGDLDLPYYIPVEQGGSQLPIMAE